MSTTKRKRANNTQTHTSATPPQHKHRRLAKPATSKRAIEAARQRTHELLAVLTIRGKPLDRAKLTATQRERLERGPYPAAAAVYLATHEKFVEAQVRKVAARHVPDEDVAQAVRIGMARSLDKFDARLVENGTVTSFLSYARWWVRCEVGKLLEDESLVRVPQAAKKTATEMRQRIEEHAADIDAAPEYLTDEDVAAALSLPLDRVRTYRHLHLGHEHFDATTVETHRDKIGDSGDASTKAVLERMTEHQDVALEDAEWKLRGGLVDAGVAKLPALHRRVVAEHFGLDVDREASRARLPGSVVAVRCVLKAALGRLRQMVDEVVGW